MRRGAHVRNPEQAIDRAGLKMGNKGLEAATAAMEMANLKEAAAREPSALSKSPTGRRKLGHSKEKADCPTLTPLLRFRLVNSYSEG